jgi:hypothetical protein
MANRKENAMGLKQFLQDFCAGVRFGIQHAEFRELLERDRDTACQGITDIVEGLSPAQLDEFEQAFLAHSTAVVGPAHRLRAMELYAHLKIQEMMRYNTFRGFIGEAGPLALSA